MGWGVACCPGPDSVCAPRGHWSLANPPTPGASRCARQRAWLECRAGKALSPVELMWLSENYILQADDAVFSGFFTLIGSFNVSG